MFNVKINSFRIRLKTLVFAFTFMFLAFGSIQSQNEILTGIRDDVQKLAGQNNLSRLEILKIMLDNEGINYKVEPYTYDPKKEFIGGEFDDMPEDEAYRFKHANGKGSNLVVTLGNGEQEFIVGAHYDKVTVGEGVVDNGASSIILIRIAKVFKNKKLNFMLRIIWFGDEELGLIGSRNYVENHKDDTIVGMIALDVNAYGDNIMIGPSAQTGLHRLYRIAQQVCLTNEISSTVFPEYGGSDNEAFTDAGFEAMGLGIAPTEEAYEFWLEVNGSEKVRSDKPPVIMGNMHSEKDTMKLLDPLAVQKSYTVTLGIIKQLSNEMGSH